ncbi:NAD(P)/FAD-dependent oxidoreductase [Pelomonas sp. SE-A7]|uniref:FAD-dependent oxidoreductase n=1 Tax=Pelomonas sp. SE-A7 TaxID=3054953 RepID=UPI00259C9372|nr:NAD(P)/FAD-dependent oxidoreductase [Pelomonas sp. SE-A7]MDM4764993.1 NAD(P)/FAD-dependent oxidoreductase [Pelomonas sp. SE-A7]
MNSRGPVAVVGAGVAGCAAAIRLAEQGIAVDLIEAVQQPQPIGAGLLLQPTGQRVLAALGLLDETLAHGARVDSLYGDTQDGRPVLRMSYRDGEFGLGLQRGALMGLLWQRVRATPGLRWICGEPVERYEQDASGVRLFAADGSGVGSDRYEALILANGSFSRLREQMRVRQSARTFPWGAVWTVLPLPQGFEAQGLRQRFRAARQMLGLMPVGRNYDDAPQAQPGINLFWSLPLDKVQAWPQTDAAGLPALKCQMLELYPACEPVLEALRDPAQLRQARYADVLMSRWNDGRVLAIGDCGHGMSPQLGQGANMALVDAHVLAAALPDCEDWPALFERYSRLRRAHLRFYTQASRALTPLFQSHQRLGPWFRDAFFGLGPHIPFIDQQSVAVLAGHKTGWLFGRLDL